MKCPHCRLENPETAQRCDCGYDFQAKAMRESYLDQDRRRRGPQPSDAVRQLGERDIRIGAISIVIGAAVTFGTYGYASQAGGGTYVVATGAIVWGAIRFVRGLDRSRSGIDRPFWRI